MAVRLCCLRRESEGHNSAVVSGALGEVHLDQTSPRVSCDIAIGLTP